MERSKCLISVRTAFVILVVGLVLLTEPLLAKKARGQSANSGRGGQKARQVTRSSGGPKVRHTPHTGKVGGRISSPLRSIKSRPRPSSTMRRGGVSFRGAFKSGFRPGRSTGSSHSTIGRPRTTLRVSKPAWKGRGLGLSISSGRTFGSKRSRERGSIRRTVVVAGSGSRVDSDKISRIGKRLGERKAIFTTMREATRDGGSKTRTTKVVDGDSGMSFRRRSIFTRPSVERSERLRAAWKSGHSFKTGSRRTFVRSGPTVSRTGKVIARRGRGHFGRERPLNAIYRERSDVVRHIRRYEHVYIDRHSTICHRIVWPGYRFIVYYNWGPRFAFRYFYPYYHRKYVFVSLGGYWPVGYRYMRYYWYGCHPYRWYGYYPIARELGGDTSNYYTYNYYYNGDNGTSETSEPTYGVKGVDHTTFADVRERLAQEAAGEPDGVSLADRYFEDGVKAFEAGDYDLAAETFAKAVEFAPDDMILPFAYCQALFADEKYTEAAEVLRTALSKVSPEKEGVFYPRGLYEKDEILTEQIDALAKKAELYSFDGDLQLLLGYQLLGIGELDEAVEPLRLAGQDMRNASSAAVLAGLLEKIRTEKAAETD